MAHSHSLNLNTFDINAYMPANPAAGANFSEAVPSNARHQLICIQFVLTTDANAANRIPTVGAGLVAAWPFKTCTGIAHVASKGYEYTFGVGMQVIDAKADALKICAPLPEHMFIFAGYPLVIEVDNIQAGDQIADIVYILKTWYL